MAMTSSIAFPNMFEVSRNCVGVLNDNPSIVNRSRLLLLTEPTEVYDNPAQGVGLKQHIWKYNNGNEVAAIKDKIKDQLSKYEPCVNAADTSFADGLLFTGSAEDIPGHDFNQLKLTVGLHTIYGDIMEVTFNE